MPESVVPSFLTKPRPAFLLLVLLTFLLLIVFPLHGSHCLWKGPYAFAAVATTEGTTSGPVPPALPALQRAKTLIESQKEDAAIELLNQVLASYPGSDFVDDAYLLLAGAMLGKHQPEEAVSYLTQLLNEFPTSDLAGRARLLLGTAYGEMNQMDTALAVLAEARSYAPDPNTKREAVKLIGELLTKKGDFLKAIQNWLEEISYSSPGQQAEVRERINSLVLARMDKKALLEVRDTYPSRFPGDLALIRLIEAYTAHGEEFQAERNIRLFLARFPNHEYAQTAWDILRSFKARLKTSQYVLGAILPLSGQLTAFGNDSLNGIRLALEKGRDTLGLNNIGLVIKDSVADKAVLRAELSGMIEEDRPLAVIGPLLSRDLQMLAGLAERSETPFITPSATLPDVRRLGSFLFSTAFTLPQQTSRLADYAMGTLGYRRFCILYPDNSYGRELTRRFTQAIHLRGGEIIAAESYKERDTDFGPQIQRLKAEDLGRYGTYERTKTSKGTEQVTYTPGFDALFLPGNSTQIALIAAQLAFYDVKVPLLGSNAWNSPKLLRLADRSIEGSVFLDGFFLDSPDPAVREFVDRYRRRYQTSPSLFAAQAYDATWLVLDAIRKGATSGREVRDQLLQIQDLPSLGGPAAFGPAGALNRKIFVIQVKDGKFVQLN